MRTRTHEPYYAIRAYQILSRETDETMAKKLGIAERTYWDKVNGFSDFSASQATKICEILGRSMDEIFLT